MDEIAGQEFRVMKAEERKQKEAEAIKTGKKVNHDQASVKINLDGDDEED